MKKDYLKTYETDASQFKGMALEVLIPSNLQELKSFVIQSERIVPRGAGTGLAGGAVPQNGLDVVIDLSKLRRIENLDKEKLTVEVEAGVILDDLQNFLFDYSLEFPVNPSSHEVATIGGMIATDAVGSRAVKYGKTSNWIKWVEVMDGSGRISRKGVTELSDYAGMEGITGIIVRACLKLSYLKKRTADLLSFEEVGSLIEKVKQLKRDSEVSMIEFLDKKVSLGIGLENRYHLLVEYENDEGKMKGKEYGDFLSLRDKIYPFVAGEGYTRIEDPKILVDKFDKLLSWIEEKDAVVFGHLSVGILHPCFKTDQEKFVPEMMKLVKRLGGQVSGEHGIGVLKKPFVEANDRKILLNVKKRTDPHNKFNVGKII